MKLFLRIEKLQQPKLVSRIRFTKHIISYQQNEMAADELIKEVELESSMHRKGMMGIANAQNLNIKREVLGMLGTWLKLEVDIRRLMGRYIDDKELERYFEAKFVDIIDLDDFSYDDVKAVTGIRNRTDPMFLSVTSDELLQGNPKSLFNLSSIFGKCPSCNIL
jgi:hypothetical protein